MAAGATTSCKVAAAGGRAGKLAVAAGVGGSALRGRRACGLEARAGEANIARGGPVAEVVRLEGVPAVAASPTSPYGRLSPTFGFAAGSALDALGYFLKRKLRGIGFQAWVDGPTWL